MGKGRRKYQVVSCRQFDQSSGNEIGKGVHQIYLGYKPFLLLIEDAHGFLHLIVLTLV